MNKVAEIAASAPAGSMVEPAWYDPVVSRIHRLGSHLLALLIQHLEVSDHFLDEGYRLVVTHGWIVAILLLPLGDHRKNLIPLTCRKE
jgi:hypothetical protein